MVQYSPIVISKEAEMPTKVLPTLEAFQEFETQLLIRGFRKLSPAEFRQDRLRLELTPPFPREGRELGYTYERNGYTAVVWTTYLSRERRFRDEDAGRVLIREGDKVLYHATPTHRTKNFLTTLLEKAKLARFRVKNRPLCPQCHARMNIMMGKLLKQRFWQCARIETHEDKERVSLSWDYNLPREGSDFQEPRRKRKAKYRAKLRKEGKKPGAALLAHDGWKIGRPENIEPKR